MGEVIDLDARFRQTIPRPPTYRRIRRPRWVNELAVELPSNRFDIARAFSLSSERPAPVVTEPPWGSEKMRQSGVLGLLTGSVHSPALLFTRRASHLKSHAGEVSFPGGKVEEGETPFDAAVRETYEEIGVAPEEIEVIGRITELSTFSTRFTLVAFLGLSHFSIPNLEVNHSEVDEVFSVDIADLLSEEVYHRELWKRGGEEREMHFFEVDQDLIWGATAFVTVELLRRIYTGLSRD